jgi:hypothetical protein
MSESRQPTVDDWLRQWTPDQRRQVEQLANLVRNACSAPIEQAIKWKRLTFTVDQDWHHWLCGMSVTREGVQIVFHKGSLLDDPARLLRGSGRYVRALHYQDAVRHLEAAKALIDEAVAHHRDMLPTTE